MLIAHGYMCMSLYSHVGYIAWTRVLKQLLFLMEACVCVNNLFVIAEISFHFLQCGRLRPQSSKHNNGASVWRMRRVNIVYIWELLRRGSSLKRYWEGEGKKHKCTHTQRHTRSTHEFGLICSFSTWEVKQNPCCSPTRRLGEYGLCICVYVCVRVGMLKSWLYYSVSSYSSNCSSREKWHRPRRTVGAGVLFLLIVVVI